MRAHGTRAKYVAERCRCNACTAANRLYQRERDRHARRVAYGIEAPQQAFVDATEARDHLRWLESVGVGKRRVSEITGLALTTVWKIRSGRVTKITPRVANKILGVRRSLAADGAYIDAGPTWRLLDDMLAHGYTKTRIAKMLGSTAKTPALQVGRRQVAASTARKVAELHAREMVRVIAKRQFDRDRQDKYRKHLRQKESA